MINFVRKDFYVQKKLFIFYIAMIVFFCFSYLPLFAVVPIVLMQFLINIGYYDDKDKVHVLLNALPGSRKIIITSKYISNFLFLIMALVIFTLVNYLINGTFLTGKEFIYTIAISVVVLSLFIPLSVYFNYTFVLIAFFVIFFGIAILFNWLATWFIPSAYEWLYSMITTVQSMTFIELALTVSGVLVILLVLSWISSIKLYQLKKI